ncbi:flagellar brake protein [Methylotuvimicrobium alcaliphilum]|uniref:Flagellar brake protein YcgR n=1 Tax=Methylotuvimicrobium alcaliphilum (strain DSM 19304 / NCIMB 14124 / VKM B-2133 / 20Z) TaxID=1091494 RepID=G4SXP1_META2|nr:flagellar brake protein [Methylotuvimicrobium alcaliphilum]CCE22096.1 YcgR family protein [Methylotuvimicrobium alcaliphilum 20Z]
MNKQSDHIVRNQRQIINHLALLINEKALINLNIGNNESFITTLIAIDTDTHSLLFDLSPKEYQNRQLPNTLRTVFRTVLSGIKIKFEGKDIVKTRYQGDTVFAMPIPESMLWLQRRQFYRIKSPISKASHLKLSIADQVIPLRLYDISIPGFSLLNDSEPLNQILTPAQTFKNCRLTLADLGEDTVDFIVLYRIPLNPNKPDKTMKIGCRLTSISSAFESCIQRYMQQIERELKQKT